MSTGLWKRMPGGFNLPRPLAPSKLGRSAAPRPQGSKLHLLHGGGVAGICFQGIKVNQVTAGAIQQETKNLLEDLRQRLALGAFTHGA